MRPIVIVGGGISGLATAYYLAKTGLPVRLIEKEAKLGGFIQTETMEGCTVELGPDSFINSKPWARELIEELGIGDQLIGSNDHLRATYIWKYGRLVPMPEGLTLMAPARLGPIFRTELLGWGSKVRMGRDYLRRPKDSDGEDLSWPISSDGITVTKLWIIWPNLCLPESMAAMSTSSAPPACCRNSSNGSANTAV